ncbi:MAG: hypothetical protein US67_C0048G0005, partial [Candidatus Woesebacteria bacterium GW2011_GWD1_38_10]
KSFWDPFGSYSAENSIAGFAQNGWPRDERYVYPSVIGFLLFLAGIYFVIKRNYFSLIYFASFLLSLYFSAGDQLGAGMFQGIPPLSFFRIPFRMSFVANLSIAVLGAIVIDKFMAKDLGNYAKNRSKYILFGTLLLLSFFDLHYHAKKLYPEVDGNGWYEKPEVVSYLSENLQNGERVTEFPYFNASTPVYISDQKLWKDTQFHKNLRNLLPIFTNLLYDIPKNTGAANSGGLKIERFDDLETKIFFEGWQYDRSGKLTGVSDEFLFLNRLMGVRYILTNESFNSFVTVPAKKIEFENGQKSIHIIEFFDYFPRQFMAAHAEKASPKEILEHFKKVDFDPKNLIYVEEDIDWGAKGGYSASSEFVKYSDTEVVIKTKASGDGFLFLSDTYYPGWIVRVDGKEDTIYRANYAFRAVRVPEGEHEVVFKYEPESVELGLRITVGTLIAVLVMIAGMVWQDRKIRSKSIDSRFKK